jgi:hypothetical protein
VEKPGFRLVETNAEEMVPVKELGEEQEGYPPDHSFG